MEHRHEGRRVVVRLDRGEEVIAGLTALCSDHGYGGASLTGIGAVEDAELGYYHLPTYSYETRRERGICEVLSMVGNVALVEGEPFVHVHVVLGRRDLSTLGGHLVSATVAVTVEVYLDVLEGPMERKLDSEVRLKLLQP